MGSSKHRAAGEGKVSGNGFAPGGSRAGFGGDCLLWGGAIFLSPVLSHTCCCFDPCVNLCRDFCSPLAGDGKFSVAPSSRPGADHLQSGLCGAGGCRQVAVLPGPPGLGTTGEGAGGLRAVLTLPPPAWL